MMLIEARIYKNLKGEARAFIPVSLWFDDHMMQQILLSPCDDQDDRSPFACLGRHSSVPKQEHMIVSARVYKGCLPLAARQAEHVSGPRSPTG